MHPAAFRWAADHIPENPGRTLEIGGRDVNGSLADFFTWTDYQALDITEGPGVDIVADFVAWAPQQPERSYDFVLCCEVFEHVENWADFVRHAHRLLVDGGRFVGTCATNPRNPHSAWGDPHPRPGEFYANVSVPVFAAVMCEMFPTFTVDRTASGDLRWVGVR
jgi:SAM-dependent methyltransferase